MPSGHYLLELELQFSHIRLKLIGYFMALVVEGKPTIHEAQELQQNKQFIIHSLCCNILTVSR
jgi:hypothetical protein